uniref:Uncharacterized protein n=1 Tax=Arundo donax TaxID=35708 RepID=A0A0A8XUW5_ARUDO
MADGPDRLENTHTHTQYGIRALFCPWIIFPP